MPAMLFHQFPYWPNLSLWIVVSIHNQLPHYRTIHRRVLRMVLRRQRLSLIRGNFLVTVHAFVDSRKRYHRPWIVRIVEGIVVGVSQIILVLVEGHNGVLRSQDVMKRRLTSQPKSES